MADITPSQFAQTTLVPVAKQFEALYYACKQALAEANAYGGVGAIIANDSNQVGILPNTGAEFNNVANRMAEFVADMEANSSAKLNTILVVA